MSGNVGYAEKRPRGKAAKRKGGRYMDYKEARRLAADQDMSVRRKLAARTDVQPEVLYYLAEDEAPEVRREIAANTATPRQADVLLVRDKDDEVRITLARKIARLAPELSPAAQGWLQETTLQILEQLAQDQLPRVRRIIAEEIQHLGNVPRPLVVRLAKDVEVMVSAPVLQYSPMLSDDDLLEIIASEPVQGALSAISRREGLSERISDSIAHSSDVDAVAQLLANPSAQIREETLDHIIDGAPEKPSWHEPLVRRADLSHRAVHRIARFITASLLTVLEKRYEIDPEVTREVAEAVSRRLSSDGLNAEGLPEHRAGDLHAAGKLDEDSFAAAMGRNDRDFLCEGLALKTGIGVDEVRGILESQSAKLITALCWKAGLPMRIAYDMQMKIGRVPSAQLLHARNGVDYPLTGVEMRQALRFYSE